MGSQLFADETKQRGYQLIVVTVEAPEQVEDLRKVMRGLVLKGQRRVHMKKEDDSRRRAIAAAICGSGSCSAGAGGVGVTRCGVSA